jgi:hypothetical protein
MHVAFGVRIMGRMRGCPAVALGGLEGSLAPKAASLSLSCIRQCQRAPSSYIIILFVLGHSGECRHRWHILRGRGKAEEAGWLFWKASKWTPQLGYDRVGTARTTNTCVPYLDSTPLAANEETKKLNDLDDIPRTTSSYVPQVILIIATSELSQLPTVPATTKLLLRTAFQLSL